MTIVDPDARLSSHAPGCPGWPSQEFVMAEISVHDPATGVNGAAVPASVRRTVRRDDLELLGLLAGITGIVLAALLVFGATIPAG